MTEREAIERLLHMPCNRCEFSDICDKDCPDLQAVKLAVERLKMEQERKKKLRDKKRSEYER